MEPEEVRALALAARLELPPERLEPVGRGLEQLLRLGATLRELPLEGVEPLDGPPEWR
jgi:Asp-tRNA(Asn)/Glu-tRNA(Gln) amidotransferase C subunit